MDDINAKRTAFMSLSPEEKLPYIKEASKIRQLAKARQSPLARSLDQELATEEQGGPWSMSASKDGLPGDWPLNRFCLCATMGERSLHAVAVSWDREGCKVWEEAPEFPETVELQEACKVGECLHLLTPIQMHRFETISQEFQLALRHNGLPAHCPLLFQLVCEPEVKYCIIGDHDWTHILRCDFIIAEKRTQSPGSEPPFEIGLQRETASGQEEAVSWQICGEGWPSILSETMFIRSLVLLSSNPWHIYALRAEPDQTWTYMVQEKLKIDQEEMQRKEVDRLETAFALRLLKKMTEPAANPKFKTKKGRRGKGRGRGGKGRGRGCRATDSVQDGSGTDSVQDDSGTDFVQDHGQGEEHPSRPSGSAASSSTAIQPPPSTEEPPPVPPPPAPHSSTRARARVAEPWGKSHWSLAPVRNAQGITIGYGATCKDHVDAAFPLRECKKQVTIGKSGLSLATLKLRMKRWLIAGLDDSDWDADTMRMHHIGIGGTHMCELANGLSEEECDRIARAHS